MYSMMMKYFEAAQEKENNVQSEEDIHSNREVVDEASNASPVSSISF